MTGMDGIGKTTHSFGLINHLNRSGINCKYVWFGNAYFFSYPFMIFCRLVGLTKIRQMTNGLVFSQHEYYRNKAVSRVWTWIQFLDAAILVNLRIRRLLFRDLTIVCDRFIPDIMVELMNDVNDDHLHKKLVGRLMFRLMPPSMLLICLDGDEKAAWRRKNDVPGLEYLTTRRKKYRLISRYLGMALVNAERPYALVRKHIAAIADGVACETAP